MTTGRINQIAGLSGRLGSARGVMSTSEVFPQRMGFGDFPYHSEGRGRQQLPPSVQSHAETLGTSLGLAHHAGNPLGTTVQRHADGPHWSPSSGVPPQQDFPPLSVRFQWAVSAHGQRVAPRSQCGIKMSRSGTGSTKVVGTGLA